MTNRAVIKLVPLLRDLNRPVLFYKSLKIIREEISSKAMIIRKRRILSQCILSRIRFR